MTTEAFALAVYEELIVLIAICGLVEITKAEWAMGVSAMIGTFIGIVGVAANLKLAHMLMDWYRKRSIGNRERRKDHSDHDNAHPLHAEELRW